MRHRMPFVILALGLLFASLPLVAGAETRQANGPVSELPPLLTQSFAIFRTEPEELPPSMVKVLKPGIDSELPPSGGHGLNLSLAQKAVPPGHARPLWLVPGRDWVMLLEQPRRNQSSFGGSEGPIRVAIERGLSFYSGVPRTKDPHLMRVMSLVPDGVVAVEVGKGIRASVGHNVISRKVDQKKIWEHLRLIRGER